LVLIGDPSAELYDSGVVDIDPVVVVADRPERAPDAKVVARSELRRNTLVGHAFRVEVADPLAVGKSERALCAAYSAERKQVAPVSVTRCPA
jgi:hypothetical protein